MSKHYCGSIPNRSTRPEKSTTPKKYLTRLPGYSSTDQLCDREELLTDLSESWSHKELLPNRPELINQGEQVIPPEPLKTMAHRYRHTEKEAHLLSGPSELQPPDASEAQKLRSPIQVQQPRQEYSRFTETEKAKFHTPSTYNDDRNFFQHNSVEKFSPNHVYPTKSDTSSVSDSIFQKEGRKLQKMFLHLQKTYLHLHHLHLHPHWRQSKNDHTLQEQGSQHARTLGSQPAHIVTLTYRHYLDLD